MRSVCGNRKKVGELSRRLVFTFDCDFEETLSVTAFLYPRGGEGVKVKTHVVRLRVETSVAGDGGPERVFQVSHYVGRFRISTWLGMRGQRLAAALGRRTCLCGGEGIF